MNLKLGLEDLNQTPQIVQELIKNAELVRFNVDNGIIPQSLAHEAIIGLMKSSSYFIGSEIPIWIELENKYTGHIDLLLFDPSTKTIYVADYKPDLVYNNLGQYAFTNAIPQLAANGLTIQDLADIIVKSLIFNEEAAWIFDPSLVFGIIDEFMEDQFQGWIAPWIDFSTFLDPNL